MRKKNIVQGALQYFNELDDPLGALPLECVIATGIEGDLPALHMKDVVGDIVQQVTLMADDHRRGGIGLQEAFQPQRRLKIEMVGRLIEQHRSGRENSSPANATRIRQPPENEDSG